MARASRKPPIKPGPNSSRGSSSIWVDSWRVLRPFEPAQRRIDRHPQALHHAAPTHRHRLEARRAEWIEILLQHRDRMDSRQIALVPLHHQREVYGAFAHTHQLLLQLIEAFQILLQLARL